MVKSRFILSHGSSLGEMAVPVSQANLPHRILGETILLYIHLIFV